MARERTTAWEADFGAAFSGIWYGGIGAEGEGVD